LSWPPEAHLDDLLLRSAKKEDFPAIRVLIREVNINPAGLDWNRFIIAERTNGQFVGCGQLKPHGDGSLELASIAVKPQFRNQGVARLIIEELLSRGLRPLYLTCRSSLGPFYEKFGFRAIGKDEMPRYFQRLAGIAGIISALRLMDERLLVMKLDTTP
jgi:N-acetylglutamate synthase-like GNAT family acetyltransferase